MLELDLSLGLFPSKGPR
uniref:Uncharacterized protein n=1 Tax=Rhizophora mucronata TaxID=61149 RepID=A0A2P2MYJ7_RHIMU